MPLLVWLLITVGALPRGGQPDCDTERKPVAASAAALAWATRGAVALSVSRLDLWVPETLPWSLTCRGAGRC